MLLLTDRLSAMSELAKAMQVIEPCTVVAIGQEHGNPSDHAILICDVDADRPDVLAQAEAFLAKHRHRPAVPILYLARHADQAALGQAQSIGATAVLPPHASDTQILFTVKRLVEARRDARARPACNPPSAVYDDIRDAGAGYAEAVGSLRCGEPIPLDALERGTTAVLAAVGKGRLAAWLDVVRSYDDLTYQHSLLVACFAAALSMRLGLSIRGQRLIGKAALLHDIGKLQIDREILNKPGKLTAAEMDVVRQHPSAGHAMLVRQGGFDRQILDMVLHHHEFLDGSGYPDKLAGAAISPMVRLLTICDIYAALVERRSYKPPMPPQTALSILGEMGGKLDRNLLGIFRAMVEA